MVSQIPGQGDVLRPNKPRIRNPGQARGAVGAGGVARCWADCPGKEPVCIKLRCEMRDKMTSKWGMVKTNMNSGHMGGERSVCMCTCVTPRHTWGYSLTDK